VEVSIRVAAITLTLIAVAGCGGARATPVPSSTATRAPGQSPSLSCAERVTAELSTEQRIGQLFLLGLSGDQLGPPELGAIRDHHVGSVWFTETTTLGLAGVRAIADAVQNEATQATTGGVRFFVAANQEGGLVQALRGPGFSTIPSAVDQGHKDLGKLTANAREWGNELAAAGINLDFAPVADVVPRENVDTNEPIGVLQREYGHDAMTVGDHAAAFIDGMSDAGIATTAKHFPGLGRVVGNTDFSKGVVDNVTRAGDDDMASFKAAIAANVPFVMAALATYEHIDPNRIAAFSPVIIGDLLRRDLGFAGAVMSDDLGDTAAVADVAPGDRAIAFIAAGGDLIVAKTTDATAAMIEAIEQRVRTDASFASRVDDAARRVLAAKERFGLLPCN
jgi:beta-N-acetylhexosaminidase